MYLAFSFLLPCCFFMSLLESHTWSPEAYSGVSPYQNGWFSEWFALLIDDWLPIIVHSIETIYPLTVCR